MVVKKYRKKRQMTDEQKKAATERLAIAREKRLLANPPQYKNIASNVLALDPEDTLSMQNVKTWIKTQRELASKYKREDRQGVNGALAKSIQAENYARNMQNYLENGIWLDMFYGEFQQNQIVCACKVMAYDSEGEPKRSYGVFYPDINKIWGVDTNADL
tara:strand:- start:3618 stop:4097 length:480 start_codon:yes stop_codon:yes gene_type:complete